MDGARARLGRRPGNAARLLAVAVCMLAPIAAWLAAAPRLAAQEPVTVEMREFAFDPHEVVVAAGSRRTQPRFGRPAPAFRRRGRGG